MKPVDVLTLETLLERSIPEPNTGCFLWAGTISREYGLVTVSRRRGSARAHRVAWELSNGRKIPRRMCVCHSCDTPSCINPAHLFLGTQAENIADMIRKGRGRKPKETK